MAGRKQEGIMNLSKYMDKKVRVRFQGGREVVGILKGFDPLTNMVLDEAVEFMRDPEDPLTTTASQRTLGICICRGNALMSLCPEDGFEEIENPFGEAGGDEDDGEGAGADGTSPAARGGAGEGSAAAPST